MHYYIFLFIIFIIIYYDFWFFLITYYCYYLYFYSNLYPDSYSFYFISYYFISFHFTSLHFVWFDSIWFDFIFFFFISFYHANGRTRNILMFVLKVRESIRNSLVFLEASGRSGHAQTFVESLRTFPSEKLNRPLRLLCRVEPLVARDSHFGNDRRFLVAQYISVPVSTVHVGWVDGKWRGVSK